MVRKAYGSVGGQSKEIKKLYGPIAFPESVSPTTPSDLNVIDSVNWQTFLAKFQAEVDNYRSYFLDGKPTALCEVYNPARDGVPVGYELSLYGRNSTNTGALRYNIASASGLNRWSIFVSAAADWGITVTQYEGDTHSEKTIPLNATYSYETKEIKKLYGSVNGVSKLCYEVNS